MIENAQSQYPVTMTAIYQIGYAEAEPRKFAWAYGYGPVPDMQFLHPKVQDRLEAYWKVNPEKPGIDVGNSGVEWPDVLGCGHPPPSFFMSRQVTETMEAEGIRIFRKTFMPIGKVKSNSLRKAQPPEYYVIEADRGVDVAWDRMGIPTNPDGTPILTPYPKPWPPTKWIVRASSWSGEDLFTWTNFKAAQLTDLLCTERVKELAEKEGWTNVQFKPLELV